MGRKHWAKVLRERAVGRGNSIMVAFPLNVPNNALVLDASPGRGSRPTASTLGRAQGEIK